jgi:hypothetical protein
MLGSGSFADASAEEGDRAQSGTAEKVRPRESRRHVLSLPAAQSKATYRIPLGLREQLKAVAQAESLPVDDLARLALERFLADCQSGRVELRKHAIPARFTLYPRESGPSV